MSDFYLSGLLEEVNTQLEVYERKKRYLTDPVLWAKDILDVDLWSAQKEICYSVRDNRNTAVAAGHGVGKSHVAAVLMCWWIDVHPQDDTFIASTAPFADQITAILWRNIRVFHALARQRYEDGLIDHPLPGYITGRNEWKSNLGLLLGQGRKPPDNKTDSGYQGLHATYLLAIGDEAAGLSADMIDALGNITTGDYNRLLLIANPTDPTSAMAKIWKTKNPAWNRMHVSVKQSPKITGEEFPPEKMTALSGQSYIDEKLADWGEDDPRYISRVLGQWAFDAGNNLFSDEDLAFAVNTHVLPDPDGVVYFGCDIARMGADATYVYARRDGEVWSTDVNTGLPLKPTGKRGMNIRYLDHWTKAPLVGNDPENLGTAQRIHVHAIAEGAKVLLIDASGLGSGVVDGLHQIKAETGASYEIIEVFGGAASTDRRAHTNARSEQYFRLKKLMRAGELDLDGADEGLLDELRTIVYEYDSKSAVKMESKADIKKRGGKSPDRGDALWYAAMDVTPIVDNPLAGMDAGDKVVIDPWEMLDAELLAPGMPL